MNGIVPWCGNYFGGVALQCVCIDGVYHILVNEMNLLQCICPFMWEIIETYLVLGADVRITSIGVVLETG